MTDHKVNPHFLVLHKYHLSKNLGRKMVISTLEQCDVQKPKDGWDSLNLTWKHEQPPISVDFRDLVDETRQTGVVSRLQDYLGRVRE